MYWTNCREKDESAKGTKKRKKWLTDEDITETIPLLISTAIFTVYIVNIKPKYSLLHT
jgi:hypothetical protein